MRSVDRVFQAAPASMYPRASSSCLDLLKALLCQRPKQAEVTRLCVAVAFFFQTSVILESMSLELVDLFQPATRVLFTFTCVLSTYQQNFYNQNPFWHSSRGWDPQERIAATEAQKHECAYWAFASPLGRRHFFGFAPFRGSLSFILFDGEEHYKRKKQALSFCALEIILAMFDVTLVAVFAILVIVLFYGSIVHPFLGFFVSLLIRLIAK